MSRKLNKCTAMVYVLLASLAEVIQKLMLSLTRIYRWLCINPLRVLSGKIRFSSLCLWFKASLKSCKLIILWKMTIIFVSRERNRSLLVLQTTVRLFLSSCWKTDQNLFTPAKFWTSRFFQLSKCYRIYKLDFQIYFVFQVYSPFEFFILNIDWHR